MLSLKAIQKNHVNGRFCVENHNQKTYLKKFRGHSAPLTPWIRLCKPNHKLLNSNKLSLRIVLVTWPLQPIVFKWRQNSPSTCFASWSRIDPTWMRCATLGPVMLINRKFDISCKLDILRNLSTFPSQLHKTSWSFATQSHWHGGLW